MKNKRIVKKILIIILSILQITSLILFSYSLILYNDVETFYRILIIIILTYLFFLFNYLLRKKYKKNTKFNIFITLTILIILIQFIGFYYLNKIYKTLLSYSSNDLIAHTSLITYNKKINDIKDINNMKIGLINDTSEYEGNILPEYIINDLKLNENNEIKYYSSTMELLYEFKDKKIDCVFLSSNYIEMFSNLEGFENIESETKEIYKKDKAYKLDTIKETKETSSLTKPFNMLLIGVDSSNDGVTSGYNADVLLLVSFNPKTLRATLTSIPRDMYLQTACSNGEYRRINTVTWGSSSSCAVKTVEKLFDIDIDYYAKINFKGVVELVNAVNGIDINVDYSICEQNSSRSWGKNTVYVEKGNQHLNGEQALAFARNRHKPNDGSKTGAQMQKYCPDYNEGKRDDYTRGKNQMKVILGIIKSATKLKDPNQAINILESISKNFQTNIEADDVLSLYNLGKSIIINDSSNLINVQRMQLSGKNEYGTIYDTFAKKYPAVTLPYKESINEIKNEININLGKKEPEIIKEISFDLNDPFKDKVLGSGKYSNTGITTLKDLENMSINEIKEYTNSINKKLNIIDYDTNETININDYNDYYFVKQKEHKDTILNQLNEINIYVKKRD